MNEITVASPSAQLPMKRDVDEQRLTPLASLLWRRRWLVVGVLILSLIVSGIYAATAKRRYASTARIYVQQSGPRLMGNDRPELAMADGDQFAATQAELVRSTPVLSSAYPKLQNVPSIARSSNVLQHLRSGIATDVDHSSRLISVTYEDTDADDAAKVVNAVVQAYVEFQLAERRTTTRQMLATLQQDRQQRSNELSNRTKEMLDLQASYGALSLNNDYMTAATEQLARLSKALSDAQIEAIDARSEYNEAIRSLNVTDEQLKKFEETHPPEPFASASAREDTIDRSRMIQMLQMKIRESERLGPRHPQVLGLRTQLEQVVLAQVVSLRQRMVTVEARRDDLSARLKFQQAQANQVSAQAVDFGRVRAETKRLEKLIEAINDRINELEVADSGVTSMVSVVDEARPADSPTWPQPKRIVGIGAAIGLMLSLVLTLLLEWRDPRVRSAEHVQSIMAAPVLGAIPRIFGADPASRYRAAVMEPTGVVAEAYRMVRTSFVGQQKGLWKTISVTSASPQEGKSTVASNLAIVLSQAGNRVLLVDADMRAPVQQSALGSDAKWGLSVVLQGGIHWRAAVVPGDDATAMDVLPCGPIPKNPADLLNSPLFEKFLREVRSEYDYVVIDTPPVGTVSDGRIVSAMCDITMLVVRAEYSNPRLCSGAYSSLLLVGANVGGIVINDVPDKTLGAYGEPKPYVPQSDFASWSTVSMRDVPEELSSGLASKFRIKEGPLVR